MMKGLGLIIVMMLVRIGVNADLGYNFFVDTDNPPVCQPPEPIRAVSVTDNSVMLVWHGDAAQYEYAYMRSEYSSALGLLSEGVPVDDTTVTIDGLRPNTSYSFYVRSRCGESVSQWSQALTFRTCPLQTKLPYSQDFRSCGVGSTAALPGGWGAYGFRNDSDTAQPDHRCVFPVLRDPSKGTKSLALTVDSIVDSEAGLVRGYAVMPLLATSDKQQYALSLEGYSSSDEGTRLLIGLSDSSAKGVLLMPLDTVQLYDEVESFEISLSKDLLSGNHIVFCNLCSLDTMVGLQDTAFVCSVAVVAVSSEHGTPDPPPHYCPFPAVSHNIKTTPNSAEVKWKGRATQYEVKWSNRNTGEWFGPIVVNGSSYTISGLSSNTRYMVSVRAICETPRYSAWNSSSFITESDKDSIICLMPTNFHVVDVGMYNVTFDWHPEGNETSWVVHVWNKDNSYNERFTVDEHPLTIGHDVKNDMSRGPYDLSRCEVYNAVVHPVCNTGWNNVSVEDREYGDTIAFRTRCCPVIEDLTVNRVRETAVALNWIGRTPEYEIAYTELSGYHQDSLYPVIEETKIRKYHVGVGSLLIPDAPQPRSFWLDDLEAYSVYEIRVRSVCEDGICGEWSEPVIAKTPPYKLTEAGVDILQIGQPFIETPFKGCIYDSVKFSGRGDNGTCYYNLMSKGRERGTAIVYGGILSAFSISHPKVMVEGGIFVYTPIAQAFEKRYGVFSKSEFDWAFEMTFTTIDLVGDKKIWVLVEDKNDFSVSGRRKIQKIEHEVDLLDGRMGYFDDLDEMEYQKRFSAIMFPSDFKETATIKQFEVGQTLILCP